MHSFSSATPTPRGCIQLPRACYRLHCILKNEEKGGGGGGCNERQLHCLQFLRSSRQVDCTRKNQQPNDLYVIIKSFGLLRSLWSPKNQGQYIKKVKSIDVKNICYRVRSIWPLTVLGLCCAVFKQYGFLYEEYGRFTVCFSPNVRYQI